MLINNAGTAASVPALGMAVDRFRSQLETDLTALLALTQLVGCHMVDARRARS